MELSIDQMSSFLMYRMIDSEKTAAVESLFPNRKPITNSIDLEEHLHETVQNAANQGAALALSGGIDSAVLAKFMPKNSVAYTFKCVVPGIDVTDESSVAEKYARECGLQHKIVGIYWEDFENYSSLLMKHKNAPIHSIEVQIYKAALQAKKDGFKSLIFGEAADAVYGGLSNLLSRKWTIGEFIQRYSFILPYRVLKDFEMPVETFKHWENKGFIDPHEFISHVFIKESIASYINAAEAAGMKAVLPYPETYLACPLDYKRIRAGENKYMVREVFNRLYPGFSVPDKLPMPRPMAQWLEAWEGPVRKEFWENCVVGLTGDQKWMLWALEQYLNM